MSGQLVTLVDRRRCRDLAARLLEISPRTEHFAPAPRNPESAVRVPDFHLAWIAICQQTRTLAGVVDGVSYRGSDYLVHRLRARLDEDPERFTAGRLQSVTGDELRAWLSDDGDPASSTVDRVEERVALLRDAAARLLDGYSGATAHLLAASKGRLEGKTGLLERLSRFHAYRDPVRKKSFLLIQYLRVAGVFEPVDPKALGLPVDYHLLRVLLRTGAIQLKGARARDLLGGGEMSEAEDVRIRLAGVEAGRLMAEVVDVATLDRLLWMIGRNCCFYGHAPVCTTGPCTLEASCSFLQASDLDCGLRCPFDGTCSGSRNPAAAAFREPTFDTDLY